MPYNFLFDLDQTLLDFHASEKKALEIISAKYGLDFSEDAYNHFKAYNKSLWLELEKCSISRQELFRKRFSDFLAMSGGERAKLDPLALNSEFIATMAQNGVPMDGALEFLQRLTDTMHGCRIYIITNGATVNATGRIKSTGMDALIHGVFGSESMGVSKPSEAFFDYVLRAIGEQKKTCIVIGDSLTSDMAGAQNASISSVWFTPDDEAGVAQAQKNATIRSIMAQYDIDYCAQTFDELYDVLADWTKDAKK